MNFSSTFVVLNRTIMKNGLLKDQKPVGNAGLGSVKVTEPKKQSALEQIKKALSLHSKGIYLF